MDELPAWLLAVVVVAGVVLGRVMLWLLGRR
jgi:membrane protein YqaA with SNARE-associated domain